MAAAPRFRQLSGYEHGRGRVYDPPNPFAAPPPRAAPHPQAGPPAPPGGPAGGLFSGSAWDQAQKLADYVYGSYRDLYDKTLASQRGVDQTQLNQLQSYIAQVAAALGAVAPNVLQAYRDAASDQTTFAANFSNEARDAVQASADQDNSLLASIGAPSGQDIPGSQATAVGDVTYGLGGYIPGITLAAQGARAYAEAAQLPGIVQQRGLGIIGDLAARQQDFYRQLESDYLAKMAEQPGSVVDFYGQVKTRQAAAQTAAATARSDAFTAAQKDADRLTLATGRLYVVTKDGRVKQATDRNAKPVLTLAGQKAAQGTAPKIHYYQDGQGIWHAVNESTGQTIALPGAAKSATPPTTKSLPNGDFVQWDPATRKWVKVGNFAKPPAPTKPTPPRFYQVGGDEHVAWQDPKTGKWNDTVIATGGAKVITHYDPQTGITTAVDERTGTTVWRQRTGTPTPPKATAPTAPRLYGSGAAWIPQKDGSWKFQPAPPKPGKQGARVVNDPATGLPLSAAAIADDTATVRQTIYGAGHGGMRPLGAVIDAATQAGIPDEIWGPIVIKAYRIPTKFRDLKFMSLPRLRNLAIFMGWRPDPNHPLAKQDFINWITAQIPKAQAAAETAADPTRWVQVAPTANRKGVPLNPGVIAFVAQLGQRVGQRLQIGTGSNHNQFVAGSDPPAQSQHWTGDAADIPATGVRLTKLGQAALILAGADPAWAREQTGGAWTINGVNILFNTRIGGNHYNHLHVGLTSAAEQQQFGTDYPTANAPWDPRKAQTPTGARNTGRDIAQSRYGWKGSEWNALNALWTHESGWDYQIHNKAGSGAVGIPQYYPAAHGPPPDDFLTNPITQILWGLDYIHATYKTPSRAWAFWRATVNRNANLAPSDLRAKARQWIASGYTGY